MRRTLDLKKISLSCLFVLANRSGGGSIQTKNVGSGFLRVMLLPHQVSSFLHVKGKKAGADTARSPCILSIFQVCFIVWRICLVGVKAWAHSERSWALHESLQWIRFIVSEVSPHAVRRVFHVPLAIVHPRMGWASVVTPSCVTIVEPSIVSSHSRDFRCI